MRDAEKLKKIEEEKKLEDKITGRNRRMKTANTVKIDQAVEEEKVSVTSEGIILIFVKLIVNLEVTNRLYKVINPVSLKHKPKKTKTMGTRPKTAYGKTEDIHDLEAMDKEIKRKKKEDLKKSKLMKKEALEIKSRNSKKPSHNFCKISRYVMCLQKRS